MRGSSSRFVQQPVYDLPIHAPHSDAPALENLPARLGYARNQALQSQFTESKTRNLKSANKCTPTTSDFAPVHYARRAGVTRQLGKPGIVLLRLQLRAQRGVLLHRRAFAFIAIDPGSFGHKRVPTIMPAP